MPPTEGGKEELSGLPVEEEQAQLAKAELEERTVELQHIAASISVRRIGGRSFRRSSLACAQRMRSRLQRSLRNSQALQSKCVRCACFGWRALPNDAAVFR
jgi:hypothetical protein